MKFDGAPESGWKLARFIKDPNDLKDCIKVITDRFSEIKEIFIGAVADSGSVPDISQLYFLEFCQVSGITDSVVNSSILDVYFTATNFEVVEQEGNDDRALCRYEFIEILLRIVRGKYLDTKKCDTYK